MRNIKKIVQVALLSLLLLGTVANADVFINEIHYDNDGSDIDEAVEIAGTAGTDLTGWSIVLYNGSSSQLKVYNTLNLSGTLSDSNSGFGFTQVSVTGIQNGAPDGLALVDNNDNVIQFLSYEGSFTAVDGPASGMTSTDIGVEETSSTAVGDSLQLTGAGSVYADFTWSEPSANTFGSVNTGQTFTGGTPTPSVIVTGSPVTVSEDGIQGSYTIALNTTPTGAVDINISADSQITVSDDNTTFASSVQISLSDTTPVTIYVQAVDDALVEAITHTGTVTHTASSSDVDYDAISILNLTANITDNDAGFTKIHDIQGSTDVSPLVSEVVSIEGIVVGDFQTGLNGFYVQEEDADIDTNASTSEGIFVYSSTSVNVGDKVQVTGTVVEYYGLTELSPVSSVVVESMDNTLPTPATVSLPVATTDNFEAFEGMSILFTQKLYVTEHYQLGRYGQVLLSANERLLQPTNVATPGASANAIQTANDLNKILLDDGISEQNPDPILFSNNAPNPLSATDTLRGGDTVTNLAGVLTYSFGAYMIEPTGEVDFVNENVRPTTAPTVEGTLKVASFNVLNYFATIDNSGSICGPSADMDCRGADSATELTRQEDKLFNAIEKSGADIIGLMEIENTNQNAIANIVANLTGYAYIANPAGDGTTLGGDAITVGIIYKTASVTPVGTSATVADGYGTTTLGEACGSGSDGIYPFDNYNRKPLAQTFEDNNGEKITIVVNHLKSKGSLTGYTLDEDKLDGQGNNNCTRTEAVKTLLAWLDTDPTASNDSDIIIMGDLNAYAKEDPVTTIENAGYTQAVTGYSYVYDGQWGSLDHILCSSSLASQVTGGAKWHINSDEPRILDFNEEYKSEGQITSLYSSDEYRTSDHDPVFVGLELGKSTIPMSILTYLLF